MSPRLIVVWMNKDKIDKKLYVNPKIWDHGYEFRPSERSPDPLLTISQHTFGSSSSPKSLWLVQLVDPSEETALLVNSHGNSMVSASELLTITERVPNPFPATLHRQSGTTLLTKRCLARLIDASEVQPPFSTNFQGNPVATFDERRFWHPNCFLIISWQENNPPYSSKRDASRLIVVSAKSNECRNNSPTKPIVDAIWSRYADNPPNIFLSTFNQGTDLQAKSKIVISVLIVALSKKVAPGENSSPDTIGTVSAATNDPCEPTETQNLNSDHPLNPIALATPLKNPATDNCSDESVAAMMVVDRGGRVHCESRPKNVAALHARAHPPSQRERDTSMIA